MKEERVKLSVDFRMETYPDGEVQPLAVFVKVEGIPAVGNGQCYAYLGQHTECESVYYKDLPKATKEQYEPLLKELTSIGYEITEIV